MVRGIFEQDLDQLIGCILAESNRIFVVEFKMYYSIFPIKKAKQGNLIPSENILRKSSIALLRI